MSKFFILLSFLFIVSTMAFISCFGCDGDDCIVYKSCVTDKDCEDEAAPEVCIEAKCQPNPCEETVNNCGMGKCIPHDNPETKNEVERFYCQCDEGAQFYVHNNIKLCVPKCKTDDDCNYEHGMNYQYCDTKIGNCVFDKPQE